MLRKILKYQQWNLLILAGLLTAAVWVYRTDPAFSRGDFLSMETGFWFFAAMSVPVIHQLYVLLGWRLELHGHVFSRRIGVENSFRLYSVGFMVLLIARPAGLILLGLSNRDSLEIRPALAFGTAAAIALVVAYVLYSVVRYFTVRRAMGIDHFAPDFDEPLVTGGVYRYMNNSMYVLGLAFVYIPGLMLFSRSALLAALFNHLYIWAHYFTVERPDMKLIYGSGD